MAPVICLRPPNLRACNRLVAHGRSEDARVILQQLQLDPDSGHIVSNDLAEIQLAIDEERAAAAGTGFRALTKNDGQRFRHRTLLGIGGQFMQQLSGINLVRTQSSPQNLTSDIESDNVLCSFDIPAIGRPVAQPIFASSRF